MSPDNGFWWPPGHPDDRQVKFALDGGEVAFGALAYGFDWQNGWRLDGAPLSTGGAGVAGPCASASDGSDCSIHADIADAPVRTTALMANLFYAPLEAQGSNDVFKSFVVGGLGFARNRVGNGTRINPAALGGTTPLPESGASRPAQPRTFGLRSISATAPLSSR